MTGDDNGLAAAIFTVLCFGAVIGVAALLQYGYHAHLRGVARLRAFRNRQKGTAS